MQQVAALAMVLLLAACGAQPLRTDGGVPDVGGTWTLTTGHAPDGQIPLLADHPITLTIEGSELSGTAACNHYGGRLAVRGGGVSVEELSMTAMGCEERVAASESAYVAALRAVTAIDRDGADLVLGGPGIELRYVAVPDVPVAELVETIWVLETVFASDVATAPLGERATLELRSDGTFTGSTGCRAFDGRWVERGDEILAVSMATTDEACAAPLAEQDAHVITVIGDGFVPAIDRDLLTLTDRGGMGLGYRAQQ